MADVEKLFRGLGHCDDGPKELGVGRWGEKMCVKFRLELVGMSVVMLALLRSWLMFLMTLAKTMLKSMSASGSPGLVPVVICVSCDKCCMENHVN